MTSIFAPRRSSRPSHLITDGGTGLGKSCAIACFVKHGAVVESGV
jgi:hypothetical protein